MRLPIRWLVILLLLAGAGGAAYLYVPDYWKSLHRIHYRHATVTRGPIVAVVSSTGTVQPVQSVSVGAFVSGPVVEVLVDFNQAVQQGDVMAKIDPRLYEAAVGRDEALLATRVAQLKSVEAQLQQAVNDEARAVALRKQNADFISDAEMDKFKFGRMALAAQKTVAEADVRQTEANLKNSKANLEYTLIRAPVDGVVINRKIDPGQTLAASFQTPEMFVVAPDMKTRMHIVASVDESDIGLIRAAQERKLPVHFTVDAYPGELFEGMVYQVRMNSTTTQNVVTYPVVVEAPNHELKLLPGMTASLSFQVDEEPDTLRLPNAALRFYPQREQVRPEDRGLLEGAFDDGPDDEESQVKLTAKEKAERRRDYHRRHVWVADGDFLKAVEVVTGLSDNRYTQLVSGELSEGAELVTGVQAAE